MTPNSEVWSLDPATVNDSTFPFESADIQRIEAIFEFMSTDSGEMAVRQWVNQNLPYGLDIDDFITLPQYANYRERAFNEIEGMRL